MLVRGPQMATLTFLAAHRSTVRRRTVVAGDHSLHSLVTQSPESATERPRLPISIPHRLQRVLANPIDQLSSALAYVATEVVELDAEMHRARRKMRRIGRFKPRLAVE